MVTENDMLMVDDKEAFLASVVGVNQTMVSQSDEVMRICREAADYQKALSDVIQWITIIFAIFFIFFVFLVFFLSQGIYTSL